MSSKILLGLVICFFLQFKLSAQISFSPIGDGYDVKENTSYTFTAGFTLPSDFNQYMYISWYAGSDHAHFNNSSTASLDCQVLASSDSSQIKTVTIYWDENMDYENDITVKATINYYDKSGGAQSLILSKSIHVLAIGNSMCVSGPISLVNYCKQSVTYSVSNYWDATQFAWTVPSGFIINSGNNTNTIHITVNPTASGVIKCTASIVGSPSSTNKTAQISVSRTNPTISISSTYDICPGKSYTISLTGNTCGIISVVWSAPPICIITGVDTGTSATLILNGSPSSATTGVIKATAKYSPNYSATATSYILLHNNNPPPTPNPQYFDFTIIKYCTPNDPISTVKFTYTGPTDLNYVVSGCPRTIVFHTTVPATHVSVYVKFTNPCTNVSHFYTETITGPECLLGGHKELAKPTVTVIDSWADNDTNNEIEKKPEFK